MKRFFLAPTKSALWLLCVSACLNLSFYAKADQMNDCLANPGVADFFGFTHRIEIFLDNRTWYFAGPELELNFAQRGQAQDVPGHCWT
ncbi:MAG: hypothetical protein AAF465_13880, partial [Pseudomonadota bacterium]